MGTISVTSEISIDESEIQFEFMRASGPGGQNVNKVASAVQLRFDTLSPSLPDDVRSRLVQLARKRVNESGVLIIEARRYRSQEANRQDAVQRLVRLIREAAEKPKARKRTKVPPQELERRLEAKRRRSHLKRQRGNVSIEDT